MGLTDMFRSSPKTANEEAQELYRKRDASVKRLEDNLERDKEWIRKAFRELCDKTAKYEEDMQKLEELRALKIRGECVKLEAIHSRVSREIVDLKKVEDGIPLLKA